MATTLELWDALAPEYAGDDPTKKNLFLSLAATQLNAEIWNGQYQLGAVYLALHMRATAKLGESPATSDVAGPLRQKKAGDVMVGYGAVVGVLSKDALLATTRFGIEFLRLRRMIPATPLVITD